MSLRSIAKQMGVSHTTLSRVMNNKYQGDNTKVLSKLLDSIDGVIIPREKFLEILKMLDLARFPQKFQSAHRTASWLWDTINKANSKPKKEVNNVP